MININKSWKNSKYDFDKIKRKILNFTSKKENSKIIIYKKKPPIKVTAKIKAILSYIEIFPHTI